ncbi:MAG: hypothetical protein M3Q14_04700 [bacterium]|nr:hypothetical protein [bacterium]
MNRFTRVSQNRLIKDQRGIVLMTVLLIALLLTFVGMSLAQLAISQFVRTTRNVAVANSLLLAEAGIEQTLNQINIDNSFPGYPAEQEFFNNDKQGRGTFQTEITTGTSGNERLILSTGRTYRYNTGELISTRKIKVSIVGTSSSDYNVYTGPGGLILGGTSTLANSDVYVNGFINISGDAGIGTVNNPLLVNVANKQCPTGSNPGPTYPTICTGSTQPVTAGGNGIYGTVCATGQTNSANIFPGSGGSGLIPGCTAPIVAPPTYDRNAHIARMDTEGNPTAATYQCNGNKTWPDNLKLIGNVSIDKNSCNLTITGDVYITGNLVMKNHGRIRVADNLATQPVIVVDGTISTNNSIAVLPNNLGIGIRFISFKSAASCSPGCTDVTGTDLYNSQNLTTVDVKSNGGSPGTMMQAYWGKIYVAGNGAMGAAMGQTIEMYGTGDLIFGTNLSSGESTWTIRSYQYDN